MHIKSFVIRKKGDNLSEKLSDECIASAEKFGIKVEKIDGVYSDHDEFLKKESLFPYPSIVKKLRPGYKGCFLSHYYLWKKCLEINEPILIFEHDALMIRPLPENILEHFDTLLVLDKFSRDKDYLSLLKTDFEFTVYKHNKIDEISGKLINKNHIKGAHGILIKPLGAKQIIESIKIHGYLAADVAINCCYLTYYSAKPTYVRVNPYFALGANRDSSHTKK